MGDLGSRVTILLSSFAVGSFAGLFAHLRQVAKKRPTFDWTFAIGVLSALGNGGAIGIAVCGFCDWKWEEHARPLIVLALCSITGLGGTGMIEYLLRMFLFHTRAPEK